MIPNDPIMLMSYLNTQLRDNYSSLTDLCESLDLSMEEIVKKLDEKGYKYSEEFNKFLPK